jgi:hypothetical protein
MLAWNHFDKIVEQGYQHALGVLAAPIPVVLES